MQRHALVHHYNSTINLMWPAEEDWWLMALGRRLGLLRSPPVVDGWVVEPVLGSAPNIGYFKSCVSWRAHTSPRQLHVELGLLAAEQVLVLGVFGFLLPLTDLTDSVLEPIFRHSDYASVDDRKRPFLGLYSSPNCCYQ